MSRPPIKCSSPPRVSARRPPRPRNYEAESGAVENARVIVQDDGSGSWDMAMRYTASGRKDVGFMKDPASSVTVDVNVPRNGTYRLGVVYGTNAFVGKQALYVDDGHVRDLTFPATLSWSYRGRLDTPITLTAGTHRLSLRTSGPGGFLGGVSDVTPDRFDLTATRTGAWSGSTLTQERDAAADRSASRPTPGSYVGRLGNSGTVTVPRAEAVRDAGQCSLTSPTPRPARTPGNPYNTGRRTATTTRGTVSGRRRRRST